MQLTITTYSDTIEFDFFGTDNSENFYCFEVLGHFNEPRTVIHIDPSSDLTDSFKNLIVKKLEELQPTKSIHFD